MFKGMLASQAKSSIGLFLFPWFCLIIIWKVQEMTKGSMKLFFWGMAAGAVALLIVVFSTGWVITSSSAKAEAKQISSEAVLDRLGPISVAQFMKDPNKDERLKELKKMDSWKRVDFVKEQGWAIMPGEQKADYDVANECAMLLLKLD